MTRMSKQGERRNRCPKKRHYKPDRSTGPKKDNLPDGYRKHQNGLEEEHNTMNFIAKIK